MNCRPLAPPRFLAMLARPSLMTDENNENPTEDRDATAEPETEESAEQESAEQESVDSAESEPSSDQEDADPANEEEDASEAETPENTEEIEPGSETATGETDGASNTSEDTKLSPSERKWGGILTAVGGLLTFLLMAYEGQMFSGSLIGVLTLLVTVTGLLTLTGVLKKADPALPAWHSTVLGQLPGEPGWARPTVMGPLALLVLIGGGLAGGYPGLPYAILGALACLAIPAWRRPGLMVFVIVTGIYMPLLGTFSLWDPWETHYGEVAREIISRNDWISLWWAQEEWFWSKPILIFWSEAFSFSALNLDCSPDANPLHPEWAVRLPVCSFAIAAVMTVYGAIRRIFGTRAGVLSALVLASTPHFFFLSHQAITDMYLVSNLVMAICMLALAFAEDPEKKVRSISLFGRAINGQVLVLGGVMMVALPQALYLITRNITFFPTQGFAIHPDTFLYGSAGNDGVPGNDPLRMIGAHAESWFAQPIAQGIYWLAALALFVWLMRKNRGVQALYMTAFYVFAAFAFMGKGIPGIALPGLIALFYLIASKRWDVMLKGQLRITQGILIVFCVGLPWYIAMFMRHGPGFTDRLLVHDHINRLAAGVHGDTGSIQYFIWQIGYATFPWVALVPAGVLSWLWLQRTRAPIAQLDAKGSPYRGGVSEEESPDAIRRQQTTLLIGLWFFSAFALFSAMITKFHHYIFPAVPPAAIMAGLLLDRIWGDAEDKIGEDEVLMGRIVTIVSVLAPIALVFGVGGLWGGLRGVIPASVPRDDRQDWILDHGMAPIVAYALIGAGIAALVWAGRWLWARRAGADIPKEERTELELQRELALSVAVGGGAALAAFVGRDLSWVTSARPQGYERLIHLFVYNYGRPWPDHFDFRPVLTGICVVAVALVVVAAFRWARRVAARALLGTALLFAAWVLNLYMVDLAPHWGMRELFMTYYEQREGPDEPVIAWQMNWKGENFYTGNRVFAFVELNNEALREWLTENDGKSAYFVTEHSRVPSLRNVLRGREVREVTDLRLNNKFILLHVAEL